MESFCLPLERNLPERRESLHSGVGSAGDLSSLFHNASCTEYTVVTQICILLVVSIAGTEHYLTNIVNVKFWMGGHLFVTPSR